MLSDVVNGLLFKFLKVFKSVFVITADVAISLKIGPVFHWYDRYLLVRIVKQFSVLIKKLIKMFLPEASDS